MFDYECKCSQIRFHRGHENCPAFKNPVCLTPAERIQKTQMQHTIPNHGSTLTDIDWLLNTGQYGQAIKWLLSIKQELNDIYHMTQAGMK